MIRYLVQGSSSAPDLISGQAPEGLLALEEQEELNHLSLPQRRRDWLLGRWTCKHLIQSHLWQTEARLYPLTAIRIHSDVQGAIHAMLTVGIDTQPTQLALSLSLSHSQHHCLAAMWTESNGQIGVDIERIVVDRASETRQLLTSSEQRYLETHSQADYARLVTAAWSLKEATYKALRPGQRFKPEQIPCEFASPPCDLATWQPVRIEPDPTLWQPLQKGWRLHAWWREHQEYVHSLVLVTSSPGPVSWPDPV